LSTTHQEGRNSVRLPGHDPRGPGLPPLSRACSKWHLGFAPTDHLSSNISHLHQPRADRLATQLTTGHLHLAPPTVLASVGTLHCAPHCAHTPESSPGTEHPAEAIRTYHIHDNRTTTYETSYCMTLRRNKYCYTCYTEVIANNPPVSHKTKSIHILGNKYSTLFLPYILN
jgi:hypothetical protein